MRQTDDRPPIATSTEGHPPVYLLTELARTLKTSTRTIKRGLRAGTFPIRPLKGIDNRLRFSGGDVERFLARKSARAEQR